MEQDFYEVLGVSRDADSAAIRAAFKRLALVHHPDKVAEAERPEAEVRFKVISEAYEILSNEETRILYDAEAEFGAQFGANGAGDWQDFYYADAETDDFFGFAPNASFSGTQNTGKRTKDARFDVDLNLEDVYFGRLIKLRTQRQVLCRRCQGSGGRANARKYRCQTCKGSGYTRKTQLVGPDLFATGMAPCDVCHGFGEIYRNRDLCRRCKGTRIQELQTMIEVYVPKGVKNRHQIVVEGQADEEPGKVTGDLIIIVHVDSQHPVFRREGADLYAAATLTLFEALTGFSRPLIRHLDGRDLKPTIPRGQVIQPQSVLKIPGEGLVIEEAANDGHEGFTGDLYLQLSVEFPTDIEPHILDKVAQLLLPADIDGVSDDTLSESGQKLDAESDLYESPVDYEILDESQLPDYAPDANDEPEIEETQREEEPVITSQPTTACTLM